jgi:hypothetical protein
MKFNGQITILASYDDNIRMVVSDKDAGIDFLELELTNTQFVNATMNRLGCTSVKNAEVRGIENVGKVQEFKDFSFEVPEQCTKKLAIKIVQEVCPKGWVPDLSFSSQGSFYEENGKDYATTMIRRWVNKE